MDAGAAGDVDWAAFFSLFRNDRGIRLRLNVPHTILLQYGKLSSWWNTQLNGFILGVTPQRVTPEGVQQALLQASKDDIGNFSKYVAVVRYDDGSAKLLRRSELSTLCMALKDEDEEGEPGHGGEPLPCIIQSYVQPLGDVRYITTYTNARNSDTCNTFARSYSARYEGSHQTEEAHRGGSAASLPAPDALLQMQFRKTVLGLKRYFEKAHGATLAGIVCEFLRDAKSQLQLVGVLSVEWERTSEARGDALAAGMAASLSLRDSVSAGAASRPLSAASSRESGRFAIASERSAGQGRVQDEDGNARPTGDVSRPVSAAPARRSFGGPGAKSQATVARDTAALLPEPSRPSHSHDAARTARRPRPASGPAASADFGSSRGTSPHAQLPQRPFSAAAQPGAGAAVHHGIRGVPRLVNHMARELEALKDELVFQHEMAEGNAARVHSLERKREVASSGYAHRLAQLEHRLHASSMEAAAMRGERLRLSEQATTSGRQATNLQEEAVRLQRTLTDERQTTMKALTEYQKRDDELRARNEQLENEVRRLTEQLREEQAACHALKRQTLTYQVELDEAKQTGPDGGTELGMRDVLLYVKPLIDKEANSVGERYAVQKVLQTHHSDLRSVFLYYTQLDATFANHWPPAMHQHQFFAFARDTETADPRVGARMRQGTMAMLPISEVQECFDTYGRSDLDPAQTYPALTYESFTAAVIWLSERLRPETIGYLSEALRTYILRYVNRAKKITPGGGKAVARSKTGVYQATGVYMQAASGGAPPQSKNARTQKRKKK